MLPDDFLPAPNIVDEAIRIWKSIGDPRKMCLNLFADRIGCICWTPFMPVDMGEYYKTGWVDMCFFCEENFFGTIQLDRFARRGAGMSSGVGASISWHLFKRGYGLYQVKNSLVIPQEEHNVSQMHDKSQIARYDVNKRRIRPRPERTWKTNGERHGRIRRY
jgi:hypothetical protein